MGGVLVDLNPQRSIEAFEALGARDVATYVKECRTEDLFLDVEMGTISTPQFCSEVRRICHLNATDEEIISAWDSLLEPSDDVRREALLTLRKRGYRLFLLSNTCEIHWQSASTRLIPASGKSINDYFEQCFLSYEMHCRKPSPEIYTKALCQAGISAHETLFIDDSEENLRSATELGLQTFHECTGHSWTDILLKELL